jgi:hypothetical protein
MTAKLVIPEAAQFTQVGSDPAAVSGKALVYSKPVGGVAQLFVRSDDGLVAQVSAGSAAFSPPERWSQVNVAASQTDVALSAQVSGNTNTIRMSNSGSVVGLVTQLTEAITAGTLTVTVTKNGSPMTLSLAHTAGTGTQATQSVGIDTYVAGDLLGVQLTTTSGFLPITTDIEAWIQCSESVAGTAGYPIVMAIGGTVTSAINGGVFYANGTSLSQDASNLYYDVTTKRLGIGTSSPAATLDIADASTAAAIQVRAGSTAAVSALNTARIRYNQTSATLQVSLNGAAYVDFTTGASFTLDIGDSIGSSTVGSVLFVGAGNLLAQDNANFFWDDTNNRLGIGNAAPAQALHVTGTGRFTAGLIIDTMTSGSVLFAGTSGAVSQDNANLFWDDTNNRLGIGTNASLVRALTVFDGVTGGGPVLIRSTVTTGYSSISCFDSSNVEKGSFGYGNTGTGNTVAGLNYWYSPSNDIVFTPDAATNTHRFGTASGSSFHELTNGSSAAVSAANAGRLRYNTTGQKAQWSFNGGAYFDAATYAAALTTGSVPFANGSNQLAQDNSNLFWDNTNKRLGIGASAAPATSLHVVHSDSSLHPVRVRNSAAAGFSSIEFYDSAGASAIVFGYGNSSAVDTVRAGRSFFGGNTKDIVIIRTFGTPSTIHTTFMSNGSLVVGAIATTKPSTGNWTHEFTKDATNIVTVSAYGTAIQPLIYFHRGNGTAAASTAVVSGDTLGGLWWTGATGSGDTNAGGAYIQTVTTENWVTGTNTGCRMEFYVTTTGTFVAGRLRRWTIENDGGLTLTNSTTAANSAAAEVRLRNNGTKFQISMNAGGYFDAATYAAALTTGSVPFANGSNQLAQDNTNFFWDNTNKWLGIQTNAPSHSLDVRANNTGGGVVRVQNGVNGFSAVSFFASDSTQKMTLMYGNTGPGAPYAGKFIHFGSVNTLFLDLSSNSALEITPTLNNVGMQFWDGTSAAVSAANTGKVRYTTTGQKTQWSFNGGSYFDAATYAASLTTGSVLFANGSNQIAQDNANLFWDDTNNRLGVGTATPTFDISVAGNTDTIFQVASYNVSATTASWLSVERARGTKTSPTALSAGDWVGFLNFVGYTDSRHAVARIGAFAATGWGATGADSPGYMTFETTPDGSGTTVERFRTPSDGSIQMPNATPAVSDASTGRINYTTTGQKFQVSKNAAAYEDVATLATAQTFTKSQNVASVALTDAANIATDASLGNVFTVTLAGNRTLDNPTNLVAGGVYRWVITQDATGTRTLAYGTAFKWPGGTAPTLSTGANAIDTIEAVYDGSVLLATYDLNYS